LFILFESLINTEIEINILEAGLVSDLLHKLILQYIYNKICPAHNIALEYQNHD